MIPIKAKIQQPSIGEYEVIIFITGMWRIFGTPYAVGKGIVKAFTNPRSARRSADKMAQALGVNLSWEGNK